MVVPTVVIVYCERCGSFTQPTWKIHWCLKKLQPMEQRKESDLEKRKWSHVLNCWVLDLNSVEQVSRPSSSAWRPPGEGYFWDAKEGAWVKDPTQEKSLTRIVAETGAEIERNRAPSGETKKVEEIPNGPSTVKDWRTKAEERKEVKTNYTYTTWKPTYPWEGLDTKKYRSVFMELAKQYFAKDWYKVGPYISDEEYKERVYKGIYRPQVKTTHTPNYNGYGNYGYYREDD